MSKVQRYSTARLENVWKGRDELMSDERRATSDGLRYLPLLEAVKKLPEHFWKRCCKFHVGDLGDLAN